MPAAASSPLRAPPVGAPLDAPLEEGRRLVRLARERGLLVRLFGGLAIEQQIPGWDGGPARGAAARRDIDLVTRARDGRALAALLAEAGYVADSHYNALYGHKQLYFVDPAHDRPLDVVVDALEMCHRLEFGDRLEADEVTLPLADLLLSKLQVVQLNHKDAVDALALLGHFPLADHDRLAINVPRISSITSSDWGWWRTVTGSLDRVRAVAGLDAAPAQPSGDITPPFDAAEQAGRLRDALDRAPKSRRWLLRARLGERVKWYAEPEEVTH